MIYGTATKAGLIYRSLHRISYVKLATHEYESDQTTPLFYLLSNLLLR